MRAQARRSIPGFLTTPPRQQGDPDVLEEMRSLGLPTSFGSEQPLDKPPKSGRAHARTASLVEVKEEDAAVAGPSADAWQGGSRPQEQQGDEDIAALPTEGYTVGEWVRLAVASAFDPAGPDASARTLQWTRPMTI